MIKKVSALCALLVGMSVMMGCDWTFGGGADGWNSRWNWVNFSGVYRATGGGLLVSDFSTVRDTEARNISVPNEQVATGNGSQTVFSGTLANRPVEPGSVSIRAAGFTLTDNGAGGLSGGGKSGSITYATGAWSITLTPAAPDAGSPITASYRYVVDGVQGEQQPGSSRISIHSFTVHQEGERLQITDNNGATFSGNMGSIRGASGYDGTGPRPDGEMVIAQFTASGTSAAGFETRLVGTFEGMLILNDEDFGILINRRISGTWIEAGGRTGNVNGSAGGVTVQLPAE